MNVPRTASLNEIKAAYRLLALELHPDVNKGNAGKTARFRDIASAYEILSDVQSRNKYDRTLHSERNSVSDRKYQPPRSPFVYAPPSSSSTAASRARAAAAEEKYRRDFEASGGRIKFNVEEWHAWHYGDQAIIDALKMRSLRMGLGATRVGENVFQSKRTKKAEDERKREAYEAAEAEAAAVLQSMKSARENLKQKREVRRKESKDENSNGLCTLS